MVYVDPAFFRHQTCRSIRRAIDRGVCEPAEILGPAVALDPRVRRASSVEVDADTLAIVDTALDSCRPAIAAFLGVPLVRREGAGFVRYESGGFYRPHRDRGAVDGWPAAARRRIALVVFLNDSFTGGVLRLLDDPPEDIVPRQGCLVAFPAETLHEVTPVALGTRDVIVDWFY